MALAAVLIAALGILVAGSFLTLRSLKKSLSVRTVRDAVILST